ncbi:MAG: hypothetical protein M3198_19735 [Actinomycetota bacterium]|nr:hypothetical protein [Actinomycetota bacterium]
MRVSQTHRPLPHLLLIASVLIALLQVGPTASAAPARCLGKRATIVGSAASERIEGTNGDDVIAAREGSDYVLGKGGHDLICGGTGDDHLEAGAGHDRLRGNGGTDLFVGGRGTRKLIGDSGNDTFFPSGGVGGRIAGGRGRDWLAFTDRACPGGIRVDLADGRVGYPGCRRGWSRGRWRVRGIERVDGSQNDDVFIGSREPNQLLGQGGSDKLLGKARDDLVDGGLGWDRGRGGTGADRCISLEVQRSC